MEIGRWNTIANIRFFTFDLDIGLKVTQTVAKEPLRNMTYASVKIEVATSNGLESRCFFFIKYIISPLSIKMS